MKKLSIIIPVYNEHETILNLLETVKAVNLINNLEKEIIIVDDYSTDGTRSLLKNIESEHKIFYHYKNQGKGASVKTALKKVSGDIIIIQDADLEYNPHEYNDLLKPILAGEAAVVYGSRFLKKHQPRYRLFYQGNLFLSWFLSLLYGQKITDIETCYKMIKREALDGIVLKSNRFNFEPEITAKLLRLGHKILELPISYQSRSFSQGKKIKWHDGIQAIISIIKYRFFD
ncbi:MAG: glycosyltransferase family 2 protein [Parcubacteria group bacterium]|nr:glycosyltransferase family 2 protein [Parcubacteria group bacterium]